MTQTTIRTIDAADAPRCLNTLALAFAADPPTRWLWPDPQRYLEAFPRFAKLFGGAAFEAGTAHHSDFKGVALWLAPGSSSEEEALVELVRETAPPERLDAAFSLFEAMASFHPQEEHWYLPLIGVDPASQGGGIGSGLLRHALRQCDEQSLPAYLEATSEASARLYGRHGFEHLGTIRVAGCPPIIPMLRRPRRVS